MHLYIIWEFHVAVKSSFFYMDFPCSVPFACFCSRFLLFTWDTHINGHKKKTFHVGKPCDLRNVTRSTWGFHVGKACCKIMQNWHRIPCKCTLCGVQKHGIPMSPIRGGGVCRFRGFGYMEFPCKELAKNGITWHSHVRSSWRAYRYLLHGIPMSRTGYKEGLNGIPM